MKTGSIRTLSAVVTGAGLAAAVLAQPVRVEPGISDVDPTAMVRVDPWADLRAPLGWDSVYRFETKGLYGEVEVKYARKSGAISAVFPRSVYTPTRRGLVAEVPPGTIWTLGDLEAPTPPKPARSPSYIDRSLSTAAGGPLVVRASTKRDDRAPGHTAPEPDKPVPPLALPRLPVETPASDSLDRFWKDDAFRARRISDLLGEALGKTKPRDAEPEKEAPADDAKSQPAKTEDAQGQ